ncbi:MAG: sulfite exporter TauE/SafE family protein [Alphaproteobacteria bacterium]
MQIYLPIAEMAIDPFLLLALGLGVGILSGMFGVGGAFILTPTLIFIGLPPAVAVASQANVVLASSISGALFHWRRGNIDWLMGVVLLAGGIFGAALGVLLFGLLRGVGQLEATLSLSYVVLLLIVGSLMVVEGLRQFSRRGRAKLRRHHIHTWAHGLPFKLRFRRSQIYASAILPFAVGLGVGTLSAFLGVGGGFVLVPLMIYLLGMPTGVVVGTSLFQMIFVAASASFFHATTNNSVDLILAAILIFGSVLGAQYGGRLGAKLPVHTLRLLLGALLLALAIRLLFSLTLPPADVYILAT